ncbi:MAG TPA: serine hydrolase [Puia sp.]|nr:serine hydrolase [Puia sp.]
MKEYFKIYLVILFSFLSLICFSQMQHDSIGDIDSFVTKRISAAYNQSKVPGIYIGILQNTERKYFSAGLANTENKTPFNSSMLFEAGSITKTFTAYILLEVLKEHHIDETTSIIDFLPDSVRANKNLQTVTFYNLLNHTSGLPRLPDNLSATIKDQLQPYENYTIENLFSYLKTCTPKPDGKSNYSNLGFGLVGALAEIISKKSYDDLLYEKIFLPFKMTSENKKSKTAEDKIQGYFDTVAVAYWKWNILGGCGKLICSASQMLSYLQYMCCTSNKKSALLIDSLTSPTININGRVKVCRAWNTIEEKDKPVIYWHNGGTYGFSTFAAFLKNKGVAVIVIVNAYNKNTISDMLGVQIMNKLSR